MTAVARLAPTSAELREMVRIAAPIVLVNMGLMMQGIVDTLMLGHLSPQALAAGAVGNLYFYNIVVFGMGLLMSLDPVVSQALGAGDAAGVARGVQRGMLLAVAASVVAVCAMLPASSVLELARQPAEIIPDAAAYARWSALGVLPWLLFSAFRQTLQSMHRVLPMALAVILANVLNAVLNWMLIFGKLGAPAMGVVGSAHATWISRWVMMILLVWFAWPDLRPALAPWRRETLSWRPLVRMAAIGAPVGFQLFAEGFAFGFAGLAIGWLGAVTLAGHQIALQMASLTFMVPFGVAGAGAVMVGRAIGRGDMPAARRDAVAALACGVGFMTLMALAFVTFPAPIARMFTPDPATIAVVVLLLPIAGMFQIFDGMQVVCASLLRGAGDTRIPMLIHILSFWAVGIPLGLLLAFPVGLGASGLWWGLTAALASTALLQMARVRSRLSADIGRVRVD
jgi:MATE family multidrug resistance protein